MSSDDKDISNTVKKRKKNLTLTPELDELKLIYTKLVSYYTFLSTRKHIIPTLSLLSSPAEKAIKRPIEYIDIARLKALLPNDIIFEYVDKEQFILEDKHFTWKDGYQQKEQDMFQLDDLTDEKQLLILEFIDGDLSKSRTKTALRSNLKIPNYTTDQIQRLILRRQNKFLNKLKELISSKDQNLELVWQELDESAIKYLPDKIKLIDPMGHLNSTPLISQSKKVSQILETLKKTPFYSSQISPSSKHIIPAKLVQKAQLPDLAPEIQNLLKIRNIPFLYTHQSKGIDAIQSGKNVITTTPTSSGKSLIYQLPILNSLLTEPNSTFLLLFPTKALSQDQQRAMNSFFIDLDIDKNHLATFDGDTDQPTRKWIRDNASIILTNPDTLHMTIIPQWEQWTRVLRGLKYVVLDELHAYKGTFGSHVGYIIRRLRRVCAFVGNHDVQFIGGSATLHLASDHFAKMVGVESNKVVWVSENDDGAPMGERTIIGWKPEKSMIVDTVKIVVELLKMEVRAIVFCSVRKTVELVMKELRNKLKDNPQLLSRVMSYRGGYSAKDRRKIEEQMFNGGLSCIVATNALEVGIDIGGLDVVIMCGFPVSLSSFEQEMGRAGRRGGESLCILVAGDDPVSLYYVEKVSELVIRQWEELGVDLSNLIVLESQLQCAFKEWSVKNDDLSKEYTVYFNSTTWETFENLIREKLRWDDNRWTCATSYLPHPPALVSIRNIEEESFAVVDITGNSGRQEIIEQIETSRTTFTLYEGGIFIHQGLPYLIREVDTKHKYATVERTTVDWTTSQRDYTDVDPVLIERIRPLKSNHTSGQDDTAIYFGQIAKTSHVFGFFKVNTRGEILDAVEVHNPPITYHTKGVWLDIAPSILEQVQEYQLSPAGAIHAAQHLLMNTTPRYISMATLEEIGCECKAPEKEFAQTPSERKRPARLVLYDFKGGRAGSGVCAQVYQSAELIIKDALKVIENCDCDWGCVKCCAAANCTENSMVLSKPGAIIILRGILGQRGEELTLGVERGPESNMPDVADTIVKVNGLVKISPYVEVGESQLKIEEL
ncbi:ATP-dependent 3'-5' DNA helicase [Martiniozyma asiatica (nom. inval.)]|nr:ATP-dependent 3'-5' DNA helicase [Martiniozyma asiatica]